MSIFVSHDCTNGEETSGRQMGSVGPDACRLFHSLAMPPQIKAFRFLGYPPGRPFKLTLKARHAAICRLLGRSSSSTPLTMESNGTVAGEMPPARHEPETGQAGKDAAFCREERERSGEDGVDSQASSLDKDGNDQPLGFGPGRVWGAHNQEGKVTGRLVACGMCGASLSPADVGMRMTQKMVRETLQHVGTIVS